MASLCSKQNILLIISNCRGTLQHRHKRKKNVLFLFLLLYMEPVWLMLFRLHRVTQNKGAKNKQSAPLTPAELISYLFSGKLNFILQIAFQQLPWPSRVSSMTCYYMFLTLFPVFSIRDFWQTWQAHSQMDQFHKYGKQILCASMDMCLSYTDVFLHLFLSFGNLTRLIFWGLQKLAADLGILTCAVVKRAFRRPLGAEVPRSVSLCTKTLQRWKSVIRK